MRRRPAPTPPPRPRRPARAGLLALTVALTLAGPAPAAAGQIFAWTDAQGLTHFTDVPRDGRFEPVVFTRPPPVRLRRVPRSWRYDGLIGLTAREHRVQPALVKAVIAAESNFDPAAVSRTGAQGLMQLMPATAEHLGVEDPLRPEENVRGGVRYLRAMLDRYGDMPRALAAYNAGPEAVDRYGGIPPYRETRDYVQRVLTYYRHYDGDFRR